MTTRVRRCSCRSPISYLLSNGLQYGRWRLPPIRTLQPTHSPPPLTELADLGASDYLLKLIAYPEGTALAGVGFSLAGEGPAGFTEKTNCRPRYISARPCACLLPDRGNTRRRGYARSLYRHPHQRANSQADRHNEGKARAIYAAILLADLKNFTSLNENHAPDHNHCTAERAFRGNRTAYRAGWRRNPENSWATACSPFFRPTWKIPPRHATGPCRQPRRQWKPLPPSIAGEWKAENAGNPRRYRPACRRNLLWKGVGAARPPRFHSDRKGGQRSGSYGGSCATPLTVTCWHLERLYRTHKPDSKKCGPFYSLYASLRPAEIYALAT